jgi:hypothetical protein
LYLLNVHVSGRQGIVVPWPYQARRECKEQEMAEMQVCFLVRLTTIKMDMITPRTEPATFPVITRSSVFHHFLWLRHVLLTQSWSASLQTAVILPKLKTKIK